jgi:hypothetical protein
MTTDQFYLSWGSPDDVNKYTNQYGTSEQWVYRHSYSNDEYFYFDNGILTSWQD